jgi:hypothetical protein
MPRLRSSAGINLAHHIIGVGLIDLMQLGKL